jgi:hypothetical protein
MMIFQSNVSVVLNTVNNFIGSFYCECIHVFKLQWKQLHWSQNLLILFVAKQIVERHFQATIFTCPNLLYK